MRYIGKGAPWPKDREGILNRINETEFVPGAYVSTTLYFRKMIYEWSKMEQIKGAFGGGGESEWRERIPVISGMVKRLSDAGVRNARMVIAPFELSNDGEIFDWNVLDTAIDILDKNGIETRLAIGPLDYPHDSGARLPRQLQIMSDQEMEKAEVNELIIGDEDDDNLPGISGVIREYAKRFFREQIERYRNDSRVVEFCIANEWPDRDRIEGTSRYMGLTLEFVEGLARDAKDLTEKPVLMNTNIHPSDTARLDSIFGKIAKILDTQWRLGLDTYNSQEQKVLTLRWANRNYGGLVDRIRDKFRTATITFEEIEAQPWPPSGIIGKPWAEIIQKQKAEVFDEFYINTFPPTLDSHVATAKLQQNGFWGAEAWLIADEMGDSFPLKMIETIATAMNK